MIDGFIVSSCEESNGEDERDQRYECYQKHDEFLVFHMYPFNNGNCAHRVSDRRIVLRVWSCEHIDRVIVRRPQITDNDAPLGA